MLLFLVWIMSVAPLILLFQVHQHNKKRLPLPPGPVGWPIFGSLFSLRMPLHECFRDMADKYGPVFMLRMGVVPTVVLSSPRAAEELLKHHDTEFAFKPPISFFEFISFEYNDITSVHGPLLKKLKKICSTHIFSSASMNMLAGVRDKEIQQQVMALLEQQQQPFDLTSCLHKLIANVTFLVLFGSRHYDYANTDKDTAFLASILDAMEDEYTKLNMGDLWPVLHRFDLQGKRRKWLKEIMPPFKDFLLNKLYQHREYRKLELDTTGSFEPSCFLDVLVSLEGEDALPDIKIIGLLNNLIVGGITTQEATAGWAFAELIRHPEVMRKAQWEIDSIVGKERLVEDSDLQDLPYVTAILKEAMRLHYAVPLGAPHHNPRESELLGYRIPAKSTVFVNAWAIFHDPAVWEQPNTFLPERFIDSNIGFVGNSNFMPFMAGRRICVGYPLVTRLLPLVIAAFLQAFEWSLAPGYQLNMASKFAGLHAMSSHLLVAARPRLRLPNLHATEVSAHININSRVTRASATPRVTNYSALCSPRPATE